MTGIGKWKYFLVVIACHEMLTHAWMLANKIQLLGLGVNIRMRQKPLQIEHNRLFQSVAAHECVLAETT